MRPHPFEPQIIGYFAYETKVKLHTAFSIIVSDTLLWTFRSNVCHPSRAYKFSLWGVKR